MRSGRPSNRVTAKGRSFRLMFLLYLSELKSNALDNIPPITLAAPFLDKILDFTGPVAVIREVHDPTL